MSSIDQPHLRALQAAGFTEPQALAILEAVAYETRRLLTSDQLRSELANTKRDLLLWMVVMLAPVYIGLIYVALKVGA